MNKKEYGIGKSGQHGVVNGEKDRCGIRGQQNEQGQDYNVPNNLMSPGSIIIYKLVLCFRH